jgi:hypothetical protein
MYGYYPPIQTPILQQQLMPSQQTIQYVNDRASAETYQMAANSSVILMDANLPRFYMKMTDASGQSTIKSYDFKETEAVKPTEYVTKAEFESFKKKIKGVKDEPNNEPSGE